MVPLKSHALQALIRSRMRISTDTTYTVSGARDHFRDQLRSGAVQIEPVKEFSNFFSVLPHHPDATARCVSFSDVGGPSRRL